MRFQVIGEREPVGHSARSRHPVLYEWRFSKILRIDFVPMKERRCGACPGEARVTLITSTRGGRLLRYTCQSCAATFSMGAIERRYILGIGSVILAGFATWEIWTALTTTSADHVFEYTATMTILTLLACLYLLLRERAIARAHPEIG